MTSHSFNILILASVATSALIANAARNRVGNGGDVIVCKDSKIELLDFYEAKSPLVAMPTAKDERSAVASRLKKLARVHPRLAEQFEKRLPELVNEIDRKGNIALADVEDSMHVALPKGCELKQIAIRKDLALEGSSRFLIDADLWKRLDPRSKAGLISHELIYEYFAKLGELDSRKARIFNSMLWQPEIEKMSKDAYWNKIHELKLAIYD